MQSILLNCLHFSSAPESYHWNGNCKSFIIILNSVKALVMPLLLLMKEEDDEGIFDKKLDLIVTNKDR